MQQKDLRTYQRRGVTRESGYHTCEDTTGGECIISHSTRFVCEERETVFRFHRWELDVVELFESGVTIVAFGGYIHSEKRAELRFELDYIYEGQGYSDGEYSDAIIDENSWKNVGIHSEQKINIADTIIDANIKMIITSEPGNVLDFACFDFGIINKPEFFDTSCALSFHQKTYMHVPYLYYLSSEQPFTQYLVGEYDFSRGMRVVLKSCNRCGRFLPINIDDEMKTLSYSLHCKKRAPCVHSTFRAYTIQNLGDLAASDLEGLRIENNKVVSYYGHQLECKACKKFFVNAPLNPQRNPQQFKEDGLRRRAIEVLVNILLERNLVHFEFEKRTKKEFSRYIWEKFDKRCFKCGRESNPIKLEEMALDHTMPLAYLYRLDESATCLCSSHNSQKSDHFPVDYYSEEELIQLSKITGLSLETLHKKEVNHTVLALLIENVEWFYDEFLMAPEYQKVRDGIRTSDKINDSLKRVIGGIVDLAKEYKNRTGHYPTSVTIL